MDGDTLAFIKGIVMFIVLAGTGLSAYRLRLRARQISSSANDEALEQLREENAQLRADVEARVTELDERVDFVERRLVQDLERPRLPAPTRVPTPV